MSNPTKPSLYRRLLPNYDALPEVLKRFHDSPQDAIGILDVTWAGNTIKRMAAKVFKVPTEGKGLPCHLSVSPTEDGEVWDRQIGSTLMLTRQWIEGEHLIEQSGPFKLRFRVTGDQRGMAFRQVGCRLGGLSWPSFLSPKVDALVQGEEGGWQVKVNIHAPLFGWICSYEGRMEPKCK